MNDLPITQASLDLFCTLCDDAPNWSGTPLLGGNFDFSAADRGNLTQLKKEGLLTTNTEEGCTWIFFTDKGREFATACGHPLD